MMNLHSTLRPAPCTLLPPPTSTSSLRVRFHQHHPSLTTLLWRTPSSLAPPVPITSHGPPRTDQISLRKDRRWMRPYNPAVVSTWVPNESGLVPSQPCSPSASIRSFASQAFLSPVDSVSRAPFKNGRANTRHRSRPSLVQIQALEAQRQLASLGEQNDVLHQQIAELQHEAESARFDGSKRHNRLNKEIRGLKAELEAATKRNIELETTTSSTRPLASSRTPLRSPANRGSLSQEPKSPIFLLDRRHGPSSAATLLPDSMPAAKDEAVSNQHGLAPSTSTLEDLVRSTQSTTGESALVVQLLAKIKELEETNATMAKAELDFRQPRGPCNGRRREASRRLQHGRSRSW
ncbi:hypothetical protein L1887_42454 [Cichorium endivia]|nr:hypothetical protein L1887_42454 [Cichorium endivia]